jgi:hypothetical protein
MQIARAIVIIAGNPLYLKMARYSPDETKIGKAKAMETAEVISTGVVVALLKTENSPIRK